jgi:aryl-alcohol dehydrogenase-like predicted oxidoreductase
MTRASKRCSFVLGTAQLGMPYGVANHCGLPSDADAAALLGAALMAGVRAFDTVRAYGASERRLGRALADAPEVTIITTKPKFHPRS